MLHSADCSETHPDRGRGALALPSTKRWSLAANKAPSQHGAAPMAEFDKVLNSSDIWSLTNLLKECHPRATYELLSAVNRSEPFDKVCKDFSRLNLPTLNTLVAMQGVVHVNKS
jgi:hypothetical protein